MSGSVSIRPITLDDTSLIVKWRNDLSVKKNLYTQDELTPEMHIQWYKNQIETGLCKQFIIEIFDNSGTAQPIGTTFIKNIDALNNKGEFGIFVGEAFSRGKGYGQTATKLILEYAMKQLNLNRVYLTVMSDNAAGIRAYENAGFLHEGVLKQDFRKPEGYVDVVCMGICKEDYQG